MFILAFVLTAKPVFALPCIDLGSCQETKRRFQPYQQDIEYRKFYWDKILPFERGISIATPIAFWGGIAFILISAIGALIDFIRVRLDKTFKPALKWHKILIWSIITVGSIVLLLHISTTIIDYFYPFPRYSEL